jgi:hypothetical protein
MLFMRYFLKLFFPIILIVSTAFAEPTVHQIFETMQAGRLDEAHDMVQNVLKNHPDSAKAYYVDAEILVRQGNKEAARNELAIAEQLSPKLSFAKPQAIAALKANIEGKGVLSQAYMPEKKKDSFPWMMLLLALGALFFIILMWRLVFARKANGYAAPYNNGANQQNYGANSYNNGGYNGGYNQGGGLGSNIMSGLATGAAAGVGMMAAEEMMHHFMDHDENTHSAQTPTYDNYEPSNTPMQEDNDFGINDTSSWDDNSSFESSDDSSW